MPSKPACPASLSSFATTFRCPNRWTPWSRVKARGPGDALSTWLHGMGFRSTATRLGLDGPVGEDAPPPPPTEEVAGFGPYALITEAGAVGALLDAVPGRCGTLAIYPVADGVGLVGLGLAAQPGRAVLSCRWGMQGDLDRPVQQLPIADLCRQRWRPCSPIPRC